MICVECGSEMRFTDEPMTEEFQGQEYTVDGIDRWVCDSCGNDVVPLVSAARLLRGLREQALHDDTTVWGRLFGTPERAAETIRERELACTSDHAKRTGIHLRLPNLDGSWFSLCGECGRELPVPESGGEISYCPWCGVRFRGGARK